MRANNLQTTPSSDDSKNSGLADAGHLSNNPLITDWKAETGNPHHSETALTKAARRMDIGWVAE